MRSVLSSVIAIVVITAVFGFGYPLVMTGFAQVAFKSQANGSLITVDGKVVGSKLAAQGFTGTKYFHERPVGDLARLQRGRDDVRQPRPDEPRRSRRTSRPRPTAILKLEGPYNPGLTIHDIPVDAVTTSGSGIDPEISIAYAELQAPRIAAVRHLPLATVQQLISKHTIGRSWGFFGEPGVNVLELNLALDQGSAA